MLRMAINPGEALHTIEWRWEQEPSTPSLSHSVIAGEWYPKVEAIDGDKDIYKWALSDEQVEAIQIACAEQYPLGEYLTDRSIG